MSTLLDLIKIHCGDLGDNYPAIVERLNALTVIANPHAGEKTISERDAPIDLLAILSVIPPTETATIYIKAPALIENLQQALDSNVRPWLVYLLAVATSAPIDALTAPTIAALQTLLAAKETLEIVQPDTISGPSLAQAAGLALVTPAQVQGAMNGGA